MTSVSADHIILTPTQPTEVAVNTDQGKVTRQNWLLNLEVT